MQQKNKSRSSSPSPIKKIKTDVNFLKETLAKITYYFNQKAQIMPIKPLHLQVLKTYKKARLPSFFLFFPPSSFNPPSKLEHPF